MHLGGVIDESLLEDLKVGMVHTVYIYEITSFLADEWLGTVDSWS